MSINRVVITGNLTRNPEVRATQSGNCVMSMTVAVNDRRRNSAGEWEDVPSFFDMTMFGNRAEALSHFLDKGSKVAVRGHLKQRRWEAKDGSKRSKVEIIVEDLEFMSRQRSDEPTYEDAAPAPKPAPVMDFYDSDCPF